MQVDDLVTAMITDQDEEGAVAEEDVVFDEGSDALVDLLLHHPTFFWLTGVLRDCIIPRSSSSERCRYLIVCAPIISSVILDIGIENVILAIIVDQYSH